MIVCVTAQSASARIAEHVTIVLKTSKAVRIEAHTCCSEVHLSSLQIRKHTTGEWLSMKRHTAT